MINTDREFNVFLSSAYKDMDAKFENVKAFNRQAAANKILAQFALPGDWEVIEVLEIK